MAIYMDNAATTPVSRQVLSAMLPYLTEHYGNPSALYTAGRTAHKALDQAREQVACGIGAQLSEIAFTACGTESDNWALRGAAYACAGKGRHIITSAVEHHAVLHPCQQLVQEGFTVTVLPVDEFGRVAPEALREALTPKTTLVSIMTANNEIGTLQPIAELSQIAHQAGALFHTDAVQAVGSIPVNVGQLQVDMLSLSGHKLHAPKGVGALYIRKGLSIEPYLRGGAQERGRRAGTENVASIVGLGKAVEIACATMAERSAYVASLRDRLVRSVQERIPYTRLNGHPVQRLPGNASFCFSYVEGESLLLSLDLAGIAASSGSACAAGALEPSHVLTAIGLPPEVSKGSLRLTLSENNTAAEVDTVVDTLSTVVARLRSMHPEYPGDPS